MAEGGEWMALHNACLYVDCDPGARTVAQPADEITREHAYLMIVAALEIFARIKAEQVREAGLVRGVPELAVRPKPRPPAPPRPK